MRSTITTIEPRFRRSSDTRINRQGATSDVDYDFAFQPIVDLHKKSIYAHEALVRGCNGSGADTVLNRIQSSYQFDQECRAKALKSAFEANLDGLLSINFMPNAVYNPKLSTRTTLAYCRQYNIAPEKVIFEFNEQELVEDPAHIVSIGQEYKKMGFKTALDDFGSGYAGLNFIATFQPDIIKIDMHLVRDIDKSRSRQAIIKSVVSMCQELGITIIAEGIETTAERDVLSNYGIHLFQGYLFGKPAFKSQGNVNEAAW